MNIFYPLAIDSGGGGGGTTITMGSIEDEGGFIMGLPVMKINSRGINADVDAGTEDVVGAGGTMNIPAAAAATNIISTDANDAAAGTGARTVKVYGLDANLKRISETVTLNGTTQVLLTNSYFRINLIEVLTAGSGGVNAGALNVRHTNTVLMSIVAGANRSQYAFFSPWANLNSWILTKIFAEVLSNHETDDVTFVLLTRKQGAVWQIRWTGTAKESLSAPINLDAGEDVILRATSTVANMSVAGGFDIMGSSKAL